VPGRLDIGKQGQRISDFEQYSLSHG